MKKNVSRLFSFVAIAFALYTGFIIFLSSAEAALGDQAVFQQSSQTDSDATPQVSTEAMQQESEAAKALRLATQAATQGPAVIPLIDEGSLNLPGNYLYIPLAQASALMSAIGNQTSPEFVGLIMPKDNTSQWFITIDFIKSGYIKDDDAKSWKSDELFSSIKKDTEEANKDRVSKGLPPLEIVRWIELPTYNASTHKMVWSILAKQNDSESESEQVVNYNTYALGRDGYFKLDLVTSNSTITEDKLDASKILSAITFNQGKRYEDFTVATDKVAEYGLAALVTGVVAKKLGLLALAGVFLVKIWKLVILIPILLWGFIKRIFKRLVNSSVEK